MIKDIYQCPKMWLNLELCESLYNVFINPEVIKFSEPLPPFYTRYSGRLESILGSVEQSFDGVFIYGTILEAATAYYVKFIKGHPFLNGNKRMAFLYTHVFLQMNNCNFSLDDELIKKLALSVALDTESSYEEILVSVKSVFEKGIVLSTSAKNMKVPAK
jgi:death-on-curing family protein